MGNMDQLKLTENTSLNTLNEVPDENVSALRLAIILLKISFANENTKKYLFRCEESIQKRSV